jgi:hypothetical protein
MTFHYFAPSSQLEHRYAAKTLVDHVFLRFSPINQVPPERDPGPWPGSRQTSRGSMSNWLYLIGSFCFVAGTLLNMVQR